MELHLPNIPESHLTIFKLLGSSCSVFLASASLSLSLSLSLSISLNPQNPKCLIEAEEGLDTLIMAKPSPKLLFLFLWICFLSLLLFLSSKTSPPHPRNFSRALKLDNPFPSSPSVAYFITGSDGEGDRIMRLVLAIYHPRNQYLLHLDLRASQQQREELAVAVGSVDAFRVADNVNVVGKADFVNYGGPTALASILHGAAILLKCCKNWDWLVNLAASDYPLITQDDFLHILSFLPRDLNFVEHTSNIGWKEYQRVVPIVIDPGLYLASKRDIFYGRDRRALPTAYKFFTGSASMILSRKLVEFTIEGWESLPRKLLLYFSNTKSPHRGYFHTLACNSEKFQNTLVNADLRFVILENRQLGKEPRDLKLSDFNKMIGSGAVFAGSFLQNDPLLDRIDVSLLNRRQGRLAPGGWCVGRKDKEKDPCQIWGDANVIRPGPGAKRLEKLLLRLMTNASFESNQCVSL